MSRHQPERRARPPPPCRGHSGSFESIGQPPIRSRVNKKASVGFISGCHCYGRYTQTRHRAFVQELCPHTFRGAKPSALGEPPRSRGLPPRPPQVGEGGTPRSLPWRPRRLCLAAAGDRPPWAFTEATSNVAGCSHPAVVP